VGSEERYRPAPGRIFWWCGRIWPLIAAGPVAKDRRMRAWHQLVQSTSGSSMASTCYVTSTEPVGQHSKASLKIWEPHSPTD